MSKQERRLPSDRAFSYFAALHMIAFLIMTVSIPALADDSGPGSASRSRETLIEADSAFRAGQYVRARRLYQTVLTQATLDDNNSDRTEATAMIARTYLIMNDIDSGYQWLHEAERIADNHEPRGWSRFMAVRGRYLWREDRLEEATQLYKDLYEYCRRYGLHERAVDAAHMAAITGTPAEQVEWAQIGIREAETTGVTRWLGPLWNNLGATYEDQEKYDSAYRAYLKAREYHYRYGSQRNKVIADYAIGHILVKLGRYSEAGEWLRPVLTQCEEVDDHEFIGLTCRDLGDIGYSSGNYVEALDLYIRAQKLLDEAEMDEWDSEGFQELSERIKELKAKIE